MGEASGFAPADSLQVRAASLPEGYDQLQEFPTNTTVRWVRTANPGHIRQV